MYTLHTAITHVLFVTGIHVTISKAVFYLHSCFCLDIYCLYSLVDELKKTSCGVECGVKCGVRWAFYFCSFIC